MKYNDAGAFVSDVRLIFDNARKYNPPKHPIHVAATKLSKVGRRGRGRRSLFCVNRLEKDFSIGLLSLSCCEPACSQSLSFSGREELWYLSCPRFVDRMPGFVKNVHTQVLGDNKISRQASHTCM